MKPLTQFEIHELTQAMTTGTDGVPVGSIWCSAEDEKVMFVVLLHANLPSSHGTIPCLVLQAIPSGEAWIQPTDQFIHAQWENLGFVWDRTGKDQ